MKKFLLLSLFLAAFAVPVAPAFADDHYWDNGHGNDDYSAPVDEGSDGHSGSEAQ
ncbi:hypothetical protein [Methylocystis sp. ATCC 49242]|uniref:hypothetical protein n=1 Tax=Methylocystis sp. ATCC 49242 TaxID=622637 RepID=UPI0001F870D1|nr:hypothetical protein [Methylocystis sp. ATCC 49242]